MEENKTKKLNWIKILMCLAIFVVIIFIICILVSKSNNLVVPTFQSKVGDNSVWSPAFQLTWEQFQNNELRNGEISLSKNNSLIKELNNKSYLSADVSNNDYYYSYGIKSENIKNAIASVISQKFNGATCDELYTTDWNSDSYFLFAYDYRHINLAEDIGFQDITVLYYNNENDCAVKLISSNSEEVYLARGVKGKTFEEIYNNILSNSNDYENTSFTSNDSLNLSDFSYTLNYNFKPINGSALKNDTLDTKIEMALEVIDFSIDKVEKNASEENEETRKFNFDNDYVLIVKSNDNDKPYFAMNVNNKEKF